MSAHRYPTNARNFDVSSSGQSDNGQLGGGLPKHQSQHSNYCAIHGNSGLHAANKGSSPGLAAGMTHRPFVSANPAAERASQSGFVVESLKISGDALMSKVNDLVDQGNVHRIVIKNKEGHTLLSVPTTIKAMGSSLETILSSEETAIGIISAIVPYPKLVVEKFVEQYM
ncbi:MAG: DUF4342 domain-containing protein [Cyanobacteria bacterium J06621_11]